MQDNNEIYQFMKANSLTDKDEKTFLNEYANPQKAKELYSFFQANKLTDKDENSFYDTYLKKKEPSLSSATKLPLPNQQVSSANQIGNVLSGGVLQQFDETKAPKESPKKSTRFLEGLGTPVTEKKQVRGASVVPKDGLDTPFKRGVLQGELANILATGARPTKEQLSQVARINQDLQTLGESDAQAKFSEQGFSLFKNEPLKGAEFLLETIGNSFAALVVASGRTVPAAMGIGAAMGAPIAGIGAVAGAGTGFIAGTSTAGMNLSTSSKILDVLQESGIDVANEESLIKGFSDEKLMAKARSKALKYGIPILLFDAATGAVAGKLTSAAAKSTLSRKMLAGAGELGVQGVGGSLGEAGGQYAAEGKIDPTEVALEGIAGSATNIPDIIVGNRLERQKASSSNKNLAQQIAVLGKEGGAQDAIVNLKRDLNNGVIDEVEFEDGVKFVEKAVEIDAKIPEIIQDEKRANSIVLISERENLAEQLKQIEEQKAAIDPAFHNLLDGDAKQIEERVNEINKELGELAKPENNVEEVVVEEEVKQPKVKGTEPIISQPIELSPELPIEDKTGLVLYHGSPHSFKDFDISKLGSGEGRQAFGSGLYFTNEVDIAKTYANVLGSKKNFWEALENGYDLSLSKEDYDFIKNELDSLGFDGGKAENAGLESVLIDGKSEYAPDVLDAMSVLFGKDARKELEGFDLTTQQIDRLLEIKKKISDPQLYKVIVHEGKSPSEYDYLDWSEKITDSQRKKLGEDLPSDMSGSDLYKMLSERLGSDKKASEYLLSKGIDGISYKSNKGTGGASGKGRNYVVFDQSSITIDEINEQKQERKIKEEKEQPVKEQKVFAQKDLDRAKAKKIHQRVKEMEAPSDASQIALRYIADGGRVSESAINKVSGSVKRARLNTGAKELKSNEAKAKDYYRKDGETLDELAHRLRENSGQEISERDIKDALMEVIGDYNTRLEASIAYLERYNAEYQEELYYERLAEQYKEEFEAEQKRIEELFKEPLEEEILGLASEEHINNLIQQYENELNRENQNNEPISEADANKKIGSRASGEENGKPKAEVGKQPIGEAEGEAIADIFDKNKELNKIGTIEQYLNYINSIFPNSKVKGIFYHGSKSKFDKFDSSFKGSNTRNKSSLFYFTKYLSRLQDKSKPFFGNIYPVVLNIQNPVFLDWDKNAYESATYKRKGNEDGVILELKEPKKGITKENTEEIGVFEPNQIRILGSKEDLEGFKQFVDKQKAEAKPTKVEDKKEPKKISDKAREQAAKLRSGEANVLPDWLRANLPKGTKKQGADINDVYAKALEVFADVYDSVGDFKKAADKAFKEISDWFKENGIEVDEADVRAKFEEQLKGEQVEEGLEERRFTKQMLATEGLVDKERLADTLKYVKQTNALSIEEANKIIDEIGLDEAFILVQSDADINGGVRSVLSQMLISRYNNLSRTATNKADKQFYWDKTVEVANFVTKKLATESGRIIQAFSIWGKLSPEALIRSAVRDMEAQGEFAKKKAKADVNKIGNKLKKANEEAIEEVLESEEFSNAASRAETKSKSKAEAKIKAAKEKRKNIINKYKGKGGITFTSGGITKEGIEFIGEMAKTYIEEGLAKIELIVEKIAENIKEVSGKDATGEVLAEVKKIAEKKLAASDTKLIGKGLRDMNVKIASVVRKHFIEAELVKTKLAEKLVSEAGLEGEEATELANRVMAAFDRIATKKKAKILQDEVENLERAKRKLKGTVEVTRRELQDEILKVTNLGGFDNEQLLDILANKVGTGKLTPQEGARLQFLAQRVKEAPEGSPRNEAIQELFNYQANLKGTSKGEVAQAIWYSSLLAGYKTHIKNIVANVFNTIGETVVSSIENPKAASVMIRGLFKGYQRGLIEARNTLKTGKSPIHITKIEASDVLERKPFVGGRKNPFNWLKYVSRFMVASDVFAFQGLKESRAYQMAYMEAAKMKKEDAALKNVSIWRIINDKLLDTPERKKEAELRVKAEGQVGVEAKRRMYELMEQSRPEKMQDETYNYAARGTFNYQPEGALGAINNALAYVLDIPIGGVKPLRFVVPFTRILTNVANNALDYEPITGTIRAVRGKRGFESFETMTPTKGTFREMTPEERKRQVIKAGVGITALSTLYALSKMTDDDDEPIIEITGAGSQDYVKTNQLKERGWKPYSIKVGDTYYSYELTPLILTLGYIGSLNDFEKYDAKSDSDVIDKMSQTAFRMQDAISNMIFIGTLADFMDMGWDNTKTRGQKIQRYLENLGKTSIPFMQPVTQISQGVQEIMELPKKETTKLGYSLIKDIPIARNALYNKINVLGEEIPTKSALIVSKKTTNDSWEFLENNRIFLAPINRKTVIGYNAEKGMDMPATDEQFYNFSKIRGQMIKSVIESIKKNNGLTVLVDGKPVKKSWKELNSGEYKQEVDDFLEKKTAQATKKAKEIIFTKKEEDYDLEINKILRDIENIGVGEFE
jgi:hypothetical protein